MPSSCHLSQKLRGHWHNGSFMDPLTENDRRAGRRCRGAHTFAVTSHIVRWHIIVNPELNMMCVRVHGTNFQALIQTSPCHILRCAFQNTRTFFERSQSGNVTMSTPVLMSSSTHKSRFCVITASQFSSVTSQAYQLEHVSEICSSSSPAPSFDRCEDRPTWQPGKLSQKNEERYVFSK